MSDLSSIDLLRLQVLKILTATSNHSLLAKTLDLIQQEEGEVLGFHSDGTPITQNEIKKLIAEAQKEIESGEFVSLNELTENSESWV